MSAQDKNKDVKVEEVNDDEAPELMDNAEAGKIDEDALQRAQGLLQGKSSKRYAKAMQKLDLKQENGIFRVTIRKGVSQTLAISKTEVYRFPNTNTFVIFGEMSDDMMGGMPGAMGGNAEAAKAAAAVTGSSGANKSEAKPSAAADDDDENVDAGDLQEKEIKLVMSQANVSRGKAIKALKNNKGDIVNTIMELTM